MAPLLWLRRALALLGAAAAAVLLAATLAAAAAAYFTPDAVLNLLNATGLCA